MTLKVYVVTELHLEIYKIPQIFWKLVIQKLSLGLLKSKASVWRKPLFFNNSN